jgi:uncharacterized protein
VPQFLSPGIQVVEIRNGVADVQGVSTSTGGFLGPADMGPINVPVLITSLTQFQTVYGGPRADSYLFEQVNAFFQNGGQRCYVVRVAHYTNISNLNSLTASKATATLQTASGGATPAVLVGGASGPFSLAPGDTLTYSLNGASNATATFAATQAAVTGSGATYAALNGTTLQVEVNNDGNQQTITFGAGATDAATAIAAINGAALNFHAHDAGGQVRLTSDRRGSGAKIAIVGGTALTALGLTAGTYTGTGNVADIGSVNHAEISAVLHALSPSLLYSPASGSAGVITLTSPTAGAGSTINIVGGSAAAKLGLTVGTVTGSSVAAAEDTAILTAASEGAWGNNLAVTAQQNNTVVTSVATSLTAGQTVTQANLRSTTQLHVGDWIRIRDTSKNNLMRVLVTAINGNAVSFAAAAVPTGGINAATSQVVAERFTLVVLLGGAVAATFSDLAMDPSNVQNYWVSRINKAPNSPIIAQDLFASVTDGRPGAAVMVPFADGVDGEYCLDADYIGSSANKTGLYALDPVRDVNMISIPGITTSAVQNALLSYCANRADVMGILSVPQGLDAQGATQYVNGTANLASSYANIYYPWVQIVSPLTGSIEYSPVDGFAQGAFARTDRARNVAKAPAGITDGKLNGVVGVERAVSKAEYDSLYPNNINAVLSQPGSGICLFGSRTLETGPFRQIPTRRLFMFLEKSLAEASAFVLFEPNNAETRASVTRLYTSFLRNCRLSNMLSGASDEEAFFVICDERNNPPSSVAAGKLIARVGVAIESPTEFFQIEIQQDTRRLDASLK